MSPTPNALGLVPPSAFDTVSYYSTCSGVNPLLEPLIKAYNSTYLMNETIYALTNSESLYCPGDPQLMSCYQDTSDILFSLDVISQNIECPPIQEQVRIKNYFIIIILLFDLQYIIFLLFFRII